MLTIERLRYNKKRKAKWKSLYMKFASCLLILTTRKWCWRHIRCWLWKWVGIFTGRRMYTMSVTWSRWNFILKEVIYCIFDLIKVLISQKYPRKNCSASCKEFLRLMFCSIVTLTRLFFLKSLSNKIILHQTKMKLHILKFNWRWTYIVSKTEAYFGIEMQLYNWMWRIVCDYY